MIDWREKRTDVVKAHAHLCLMLCATELKISYYYCYYYIVAHLRSVEKLTKHFFTALTLLAGWQGGHLADKNFAAAISKGSSLEDLWGRSLTWSYFHKNRPKSRLKRAYDWFIVFFCCFIALYLCSLPALCDTFPTSIAWYSLFVLKVP